MLAYMLVLALRPGADPGSAMTTDELRALAEEHMHARRFVEAGEAYLQLARRPEVRPRDELFEAHSNFDSAFQAAGDSRQLCRALRIAERVVGDGKFNHDEQRKFWVEILDDDLSRLAEDAAEKKTANCRYSAAGRRLEPVALLTDENVPRAPDRVEVASPAAPPGPTARDARRTRARAAAGGMLLGLGLGFIGLTTGATVAHGLQLAVLDRLRDGAPVRGGLTDEEKRYVSRLSADALESRAAAIGLGIAAAATFIPGVVLLARRHRVWRREVAFVPHGGPRSAGVVLRLNF